VYPDAAYDARSHEWGVVHVREFSATDRDVCFVQLQTFNATNALRIRW
jgi:hypothetical protein